MSDDLRQREPDRVRGDDPTVQGTPSDHAGTGSGVTGPAPGGGESFAAASQRDVHDEEPPRTEEEDLAASPAGDPEPPGGPSTSAGGGYGTASDRQSSGGSGDGERAAGDEPGTDWLRDAPGGPPDPA